MSAYEFALEVRRNVLSDEVQFMKINDNYVIDVHQRSVVVSEDVVGSLSVTHCIQFPQDSYQRSVEFSISDDPLDSADWLNDWFEDIESDASDVMESIQSYVEGALPLIDIFPHVWLNTNTNTLTFGNMRLELMINYDSFTFKLFNDNTSELLYTYTTSEREAANWERLSEVANNIGDQILINVRFPFSLVDYVVESVKEKVPGLIVNRIIDGDILITDGYKSVYVSEEDVNINLDANYGRLDEYDPVNSIIDFFNER